MTTIGFGAQLRPRRPVRVERHATASWGWRWSCNRCGKAATCLPAWADALNAAVGHDCQPEGSSASPQISVSARYSTRYYGWTSL